MRIKINVDEKYDDIEIIVNSNKLDGEIDRIIASLRMLEQKMTGMRDGQTYILDAKQILYIDTVSKKTFIYTAKHVYETPLRLYEIEEKLGIYDFIRVGKSCILNFNMIKALKADLDGRLLVTMENNEQLVVSRQYAIEIKKKLGGMGR